VRFSGIRQSRHMMHDIAERRRFDEKNVGHVRLLIHIPSIKHARHNHAIASIATMAIRDHLSLDQERRLI
jgi:hypothetical protein